MLFAFELILIPPLVCLAILGVARLVSSGVARVVRTALVGILVALILLPPIQRALGLESAAGGSCSPVAVGGGGGSRVRPQRGRAHVHDLSRVRPGAVRRPLPRVQPRAPPGHVVGSLGGRRRAARDPHTDRRGRPRRIPTRGAARRPGSDRRGALPRLRPTRGASARGTRRRPACRRTPISPCPQSSPARCRPTRAGSRSRPRTRDPCSRSSGAPTPSTSSRTSPRSARPRSANAARRQWGRAHRRPRGSSTSTPNSPRISPARWLPSINNRWAGFGEDVEDVAAVPRVAGDQELYDHVQGQFRESEATDHVARFQSFIASIDARQSPGLWFLHVLLPHTPYARLSDGHAYNGGRQPQRASTRPPRSGRTNPR